MRYNIVCCFQSSGQHKSKASPSEDEYVLDQLAECEDKLQKVLEELDGKELQDVLKEMEDEDVSDNNVPVIFACGYSRELAAQNSKMFLLFSQFQAENKLPPYNTRVKFPAAQKDVMFDGKQIPMFHTDEVLHTRTARSWTVKHNTHKRFMCLSGASLFRSDEEDSGDDEGDLMTRNTIKRQAQQVLEQRNRRKVTKRKKPKK